MARPMFRKFSIALLAAAAPHAALHAADQSIVVLGRGLSLPPGTPAYGSVTLDRERLNSEASGELESALSDIAGFQQFRRSDSRSSNPSAQGVTLRALGGNATSRALVLLDGVPQADPFFGSIPFNALVPDRLGLARVTRGGGAGAFGAGTVAGTIELFSADRAQLPLVEGSAFYGSRNAQELDGSFSPDVGAGFLSISGKWARGDGFYTTPQDQRVPASVPARYRNWSLGFAGDAPVGATGELQGRVTIFRDDRTLRFAGQDSGIEGQDASLRYLSRGRWQVEALAYVQLRNFNNIVISSSSYKPVLNQRNTPATGIGGKIELRPPVGGNHVLRFGIDTRYAQADMYEDALVPVIKRREAAGQQVTTGAYVEDDWTLGDVVLTGGVRGDHWTIGHAHFTERAADGTIDSSKSRVYPDRDGWEASVRGGLLWHADEAVALRAAGYTSFRLPTLNELYRSFAVFPVTTNANADLAPERLKGGEVGIDVKPIMGIRLSATAFYNRLDNAIANVTIGTNLRQRQNVDAIIAKGIELSGSFVLGHFDLNASYAYNDSHVRAGPVNGLPNAMNGKRPAQSPQHMASATLGWTSPGQVRLAATLRYVGPQFEDDLETDTLPGVASVDGYARLPIGHGFDLVGRVENALDATIITRNQGGSSGIDLGAPRTFWIGITFGK